jgi:hypothetical protein
MGRDMAEKTLRSKIIMNFNKMLEALHLRPSKTKGEFVGRVATHDVAFQFRMGAGFAGDVNRTHPASIEPCLIDASAPPTYFGQPVVIDPTTQGGRPIVAGDSALTSIYGVTVRPYPAQSSSVAFGGVGAAPASGVMDVLRSGYIMVPVSGSVTPVKGGTVYVWYAASTGTHVQGGLEASATGGSTFALDSHTTWNGGSDANGTAELAFNI